MFPFSEPLWGIQANSVVEVKFEPKTVIVTGLVVPVTLDGDGDFVTSRTGNDPSMLKFRLPLEPETVTAATPEFAIAKFETVAVI